VSPSALFVCRGSERDGLGHLIRTRAVVEASDGTLDASVIAIGDRHAEALLAELPVPYRVVADESEAVEYGRAANAEAVVFDLIGLSETAWTQLTAGRITASLSPIFDHLARVDLAFNRTSYPYPGIAPPETARRYGLEYAIVRPECRRIDTGTFARQLDDDVLSLAVSMGGADAPNRTLEVLQALRGLPVPATFWVLLGEGYAHSYRALVDQLRLDRRHEIILAKTNRSMWRILGNCSLAILAGGITTYEAAYAGLPSINVLDREADHFLIRELIERGAALGAEVVESGLDGLASTVAALQADRERLLHAHRATRGLIDERGAERTVLAIAAALRPVGVG
jgi:spore coat polysaccharide biosynthesis predicted glycosyltransferase SpsG